MLEIVPPGLHIDFLGKAKGCIALSIVVIIIGLSAIVWRGGLNQGIDFRRGAHLDVEPSVGVDSF